MSNPVAHRVRLRILAGEAFIVAVAAVGAPIAMAWGTDWNYSHGDVAVSDPYHIIPILILTCIAVPSFLAAWGLVLLGRQLVRGEAKNVGYLLALDAVILTVSIGQLGIKDGKVPSLWPGALTLILGALSTGLAAAVVAEGSALSKAPRLRSEALVVGIGTGVTALCVFGALFLAARIP